MTDEPHLSDPLRLAVISKAEIGSISRDSMRGYLPHPEKVILVSKVFN
jgi:hypothetical protein